MYVVKDNFTGFSYAIEFCTLDHLVSPSSVLKLDNCVSFRVNACRKVLISSSS